MKIYNKTRVTKLQALWPLIPKDHVVGVDQKIEQKLYESLPGRTVNVPDDLGTFWLSKWGHIVITDEEANKMVAASRAEVAEREQKIAELQGKLKDTEDALVAATVASNSRDAKLTALEQVQDLLKTKDAELAELRALLEQKTNPTAERDQDGS